MKKKKKKKNKRKKKQRDQNEFVSNLVDSTAQFLLRHVNLIPGRGPFLAIPENYFGSAKPFLIMCTLKTKKCTGRKLFTKGNFVDFKNMRKEQLRKLKV